MKNLEISLMTTDYHRTHPLFSGAVSIESATLKVCPPPVQGDACYKPVYELFDVAEMSLSWYVMARCRGEPLIALPVFPLRMFVHPYLFCRADAGISGPKDLKGKIIGIQQYRITVGLWMRGILAERHGVRPNDLRWITCEPEGAGFHIPPNLEVELRAKDVETLLLEGELDALLSPNVAKSFRSGDPRIRRVFADCRASVQQYFQDTGIFPITHTMVVQERLVRENPSLCKEIVGAFERADRICRLEYEYPKRFSFPTAVLFLEEEEERFGKDLWAHGIDANRAVLEKFVRYAREQEYISFEPQVNELFVPLKT